MNDKEYLLTYRDDKGFQFEWFDDEFEILDRVKELKARVDELKENITEIEALYIRVIEKLV